MRDNNSSCVLCFLDEVRQLTWIFRCCCGMYVSRGQGLLIKKTPSRCTKNDPANNCRHHRRKDERNTLCRQHKPPDLRQNARWSEGPTKPAKFLRGGVKAVNLLPGTREAL